MIKDQITSYLTLNDLGALQISGSWGSGKTYYLRRTLIDHIKREGYNPIVVSVFGTQSIEEITKKIFNEYFKTVKVDEKTNREKLSHYIKKVKIKAEKIIKNTNWLKNYVDIDGLINLSSNLHSIIDAKTVICFDDFERLSKNIEKDDFLGFVNELVENSGLKVIIIANEIGIKEGELSYKEKVVGKTIWFTPDIPSIYESIIISYENAPFQRFMTENTFIKNSLNAKFGEVKDIEIPELEKNLSNIRTLKFAIEHFVHIFNGLTKGIEITPQWEKKLNNIWTFVLGVSVEFKNNTISYKKRENLNNYEPIYDFSNLDLCFSHASQDPPPREDPYKFAKTFVTNYHTRLGEPFLYYESIYDYLTSGNGVDYGLLKEKFSSEFIETETIPSVALWQKFQHGIWHMTNDEFEEDLRQLLFLNFSWRITGVISLSSSLYFFVSIRTHFGTGY